MQKSFLVLAFLIFSFSADCFAGFYARKIETGQAWYMPQIQKLENKIEVFGLFYETTINLKLKLGQGYFYPSYTCQDPPSGKYEFIWTFSLPQNVYVKEFKILDKNSGNFVSAAVIKLSTAESNYNPNSSVNLNALLRQYMRRNYNGNYDLQYDMRISPINWDESVELIIKYVSPCEMSYEKRIISDYSYQFNAYPGNCFTNAPVKFLVKDYNNLDSAPQNFQNISAGWVKENDFWKAEMTQYYSNFRLALMPESTNGKYLRTSSRNANKFYQLATVPHIRNELRYPRKIVIAFDLVQKNISSYSRNGFLEMIKEALLVSTTDEDSLIFVTSDFNVEWLKNEFSKKTVDFINTNVESIKQKVPMLNSLPFMLKDIVQFLNEKKKDAEVWIVSDDYKTAVRAETVMELLNQTFYKAQNKIKFNIADISYGYYGYNIQNKYYTGNEYLYENLTRLSGGNFVKMYNKYYLSMIDDALDCWAPKVSTVEIDPIPSNGFSYSRVNLNGTRNNFNITSRYFQLGMFEGESPLKINYYGNYLSQNYLNNIELSEDNSVIPDNLVQNTALYWYGNYIMKDLFLQPQSFSTIKYIEDLSVQEKLLTPYSGFILPGPAGYSGFVRVYIDEYAEPIPNDPAEKEPEIPAELSLSSYPNPFNPSTTILLKITKELINENKQFDIYNILGQKVKSYNLAQYEDKYEIRVDWNGLNDAGETVSSGMYFAVFRSGTVVKSLKLLLVR